MKVHQLRQEQWLPISLEEAWEFFSTPRNLDKITPKEMGFQIESLPSEKLYEGEIITYRVKLAPGIWRPWVTEIKTVEERRSFIDEQRAGPYRFWHHRHLFEEMNGGVQMSDLVHYAVGYGFLGEIANTLFVRKKLEEIFSFRRKVLDEHFGKD